MVTRDVTINFDNGLEVRPIAMLVQVASQFKSDVYIEHGNKKVNTKSIMGMMTLVLDKGETVKISADGDDEQEAIDAVEKYLECK